jgi:hypothetical protein
MRIETQPQKSERMFSFLTLTESNNLSRRTTGTIEIYHTLCLINCGESLLPPFTRIVGSLVANGDTECHDLVGLKVKNWGEFHPPLLLTSGSYNCHSVTRTAKIEGANLNRNSTEFSTPIKRGIVCLILSVEPFLISRNEIGVVGEDVEPHGGVPC